MLQREDSKDNVQLQRQASENDELKQKRMIMEQKREAEIKRRQLIEQFNNDIQSQVRRLNIEGA